MICAVCFLRSERMNRSLKAYLNKARTQIQKTTVHTKRSYLMPKVIFHANVVTTSKEDYVKIITFGINSNIQYNNLHGANLPQETDR